MAAKTNPHGADDKNFPTHQRDYVGFITLLKYTIIAVAIISAVVIYIISN